MPTTKTRNFHDLEKKEKQMKTFTSCNEYHSFEKKDMKNKKNIYLCFAKRFNIFRVRLFSRIICKYHGAISIPRTFCIPFMCLTSLEFPPNPAEV